MSPESHFSVPAITDVVGGRVDLMCDAAAYHLGAALVRLKLGAPWLQNGTLVRLFDRTVPSPHAHYLCWRTGTMERWECATFADWLKSVLA